MFLFILGSNPCASVNGGCGELCLLSSHMDSFTCASSTEVGSGAGPIVCSSK